MKHLCVVDTCSLIYLSDIELARSALHKWLREEFDVRYSQFVWKKEIIFHMKKMGSDGRWFLRHGEDLIWPDSRIRSHEAALFSDEIEAGRCWYCKAVQGTGTSKCWYCNCVVRKGWTHTPNLSDPIDRGERHNCCVALDAILTNEYPEAICLTDDIHAIRQYINPVFSMIRLGQIWCSFDLVLNLFTRYRKTITLEMALAALKNINEKISTSAQQNSGNERPERNVRRLALYSKKAEDIDRFLARTKGGR